MSPRRAYAVSWSEDGGPQHVGKLELHPTLVRLEGGSAGGHETGRSTPYDGLARIASTRTNGERASVLVLRDGSRIVVTSLDGPGALIELESELRTRTGKPHEESVAAPMPADS